MQIEYMALDSILKRRISVLIVSFDGCRFTSWQKKSNISQLSHNQVLNELVEHIEVLYQLSSVLEPLGIKNITWIYP